MEDKCTELISDRELISLDTSIFEVRPSNLGDERAAEIVEQELFSLLDQCFMDFPLINPENITKTFEGINRFLEISEIAKDKQLQEYINQCLYKAAMMEYN